MMGTNKEAGVEQDNAQGNYHELIPMNLGKVLRNLPLSFYTGPSIMLLNGAPMNRIMHFYDPPKTANNCQI